MKHLKLCLIVVITVLSGCYSDEFSEKPERFFSEQDLPTYESYLYVTTTVDLLKAQVQLNKSFPATLITFSDKTKKCFKNKLLGVNVSVGCEWWGEARRRGEVTLRGKSDRVIISIPIHAWGTVESTGLIKARSTVKTDLTVQVSSTLRIDENLDVLLDVDTEYSWDKKPTLRLFDLIDISLGDFVEPALNKQLAKLNLEITDQIKEFDLKSKMIEAWNALRQPILISDAPAIWLRVEPKDAYFSGIYTNKNILSATVGVRAKVESFVGPQPATPQIDSVPKISATRSGRDGFFIGMPIFISYATIVKELEKAARIGEKHAPFEDKPDHYYTVQSVEVYPSGENFALAIRFEADLPNRFRDARGSVYLTGQPDFDNESKVFRIQNLKFTRTTDSFYFNTMSRLYKEQIEERLNELTRIDCGEAYDQLTESINGTLNKDLENGSSVEGKIETAKVDGIYARADGILVNLQAKGELRLKMFHLE